MAIHPWVQGSIIELSGLMEKNWEKEEMRRKERGGGRSEEDGEDEKEEGRGRKEKRNEGKNHTAF